MRISKQTLETLNAQGVSVRWYPEKTFNEFSRRIWERDYNSYIKYYQDHVATAPAAIEGRANVLFQTLDELKEHARQNADRYEKYGTGRAPYEFTVLYIEYAGKLIMKKENVKSKEITAEYVQKLIEKNEKAYNGYYGTFALNMQRLLKDNGLSNNFAVYPTTYGIGVWFIYNWHAEEEINKVTDILNARNVEYYNEYSEKRWVYRFKVSKKAENLAKVA